MKTGECVIIAGVTRPFDGAGERIFVRHGKVLDEKIRGFKRCK
jgi:hypothetical protein